MILDKKWRDLTSAGEFVLWRERVYNIDMYNLPEVNIVAPVAVEADWIYAMEHPEPVKPSNTGTSTPVSSGAKVLKYTIGVRGNVKSDYEEFRRMVNATLNDARGWVRAGVKFQEVESGAGFAVWLQEPAIFDTYAGCDSTLSCRSGNNVMINDDRWRLGTEYWTTTGLGIDDYRRLIINHEVGHWLDHRHVNTPCSSTSVVAPLMLESSLRATCAPGIWPLEGELWHNR